MCRLRSRRRCAAGPTALSVLPWTRRCQHRRTAVMAIFGLVDAKGAMVQSGRRELSASLAGDYRVTFDAPVAPGRLSRLRFVVADATANLGAVQHDVNATFTRFGAVQVAISSSPGPPPTASVGFGPHWMRTTSDCVISFVPRSALTG